MCSKKTQLDSVRLTECQCEKQKTGLEFFKSLAQKVKQVDEICCQACGILKKACGQEKFGKRSDIVKKLGQKESQASQYFDTRI